MGTTTIFLGTDGTHNHKDNDEADGSRTNIAKLFDLFDAQGENGVIALYEKGVGTRDLSDEEHDQIRDGLAEKTDFYSGVEGGLAWDDILDPEVERQGLRSQVDNMMSQLKDTIEDINPSDTIVIQAAGFSRGATAMREVINQIHTTYPELITSGRLVIDNVILYDTVASYGLANELNSGFNLNLGEHSANHIYHYTALDEYRSSFPLESLQDDNGELASNIEETVLFGSHSDQGGGYSTDDNLERLVFDSGTLGIYINEQSRILAENDFRDQAEDQGLLVEFDHVFGNNTTTTTYRLIEERVVQEGLSNVAFNLAFNKLVENGANIGDVSLLGESSAVPDDLLDYYNSALNGEDISQYWSQVEQYIHTSYSDEYADKTLIDIISNYRDLDGTRDIYSNEPDEAYNAFDPSTYLDVFGGLVGYYYMDGDWYDGNNASYWSGIVPQVGDDKSSELDTIYQWQVEQGLLLPRDDDWDRLFQEFDYVDFDLIDAADGSFSYADSLWRYFSDEEPEAGRYLFFENSDGTSYRYYDIFDKMVQVIDDANGNLLSNIIYDQLSCTEFTQYQRPIYTIQSYETLLDIAQSLDTSVESLLKFNPQITDPEQIQDYSVIYYPDDLIDSDIQLIDAISKEMLQSQLPLIDVGYIHTGVDDNGQDLFQIISRDSSIFNLADNTEQSVETVIEDLLAKADSFSQYGSTNYDTTLYGFDIDTSFSYGNLGQETETFGFNFDSILNDGLLWSSGNASFTSVTANDSGFWVEMNAAISDSYQPGRSNLIDSTISQDFSDLWNSMLWEDELDLYDPLNLNDFSFTSSYLSNRSTWLAEIDPLILDLDGDGIELTPFGDNYIFFDIDNDGHRERTGWMAPDDAMLVHDLNSDGKINDITEALSEYYGADRGTGAVWSSSFAALASLDSNHDGVINASDTAFSDLRIWQDINQNGETEDGELQSLTDAGITELSLNDTADGSFTGGNEVKSNSSYQRSDGTEQTLAAVNFIADPSGLTDTVDGSGRRVEVEDGAATYTVGSEQGESITATDKQVTNIIGGIGNDVLTGDDQNNWLVGSLGEDQLIGGGGHDYLVADAEDIANTQDNIQGGDGFDIVQFVGDEGVVFNLQQSQVEMAIGTDQADILASGSSDQSIINGGAGNDVLLGGSADDVLNGEEGKDSIYGHLGDDLLRGHRGDDKLTGGGGEDILQGGLGDDLLYGSAGEDLLNGGAGNDYLDGGADYDVAHYTGSYADYAVVANGDGSHTVTDLRADSPDGTDTLVDIEAFNFADINEVQMDADGPMPVKDQVRVTAEADGLTHRIAVADLLANDLDYQGDDLILREAFDAKGGSVSIDDNEIVFVLDEGFTGIPTFSYRIQDSQGNNGLQVGVRGTEQTAEMTAQVTLLLDHHPEDPTFLDQWYLSDINVLPVWSDYTGDGIKVGVFEPGPWDAEEYGQIDYSHPDLLPNIDAESLRTQNPNIEPTQHATLVAGVIGAARNDIGSVGVAYDVTLGSEGIRESDMNSLLNWRNYDVANNSWGQEDVLFNNVVADQNGTILTQALFEDAVIHGRDGLGSIVVFGGGNDRQNGCDTNAQDLTNNRLGITVGAINAEDDLGNLQLSDEPFSNPGASILVSAPGSNVTSTSRLVENENGSTFGSDYETTQGTSFAAPIVSGVVALMLEANPELGWRDVQKILALSAKQIDDPNTQWQINGSNNWNGGGMHTSHDYGFGLVDAHAAVRLAETWETWQQQGVWSNEEKLFYQSGDLSQVIPDGVGEVSHTITVTDDIELENVEVVLDLQHEQMGDMEIVLIGPDGTESVLINRPGVAPDGNAGERGYGALDRTWLTTTTNHWGGDSAGEWTLVVRDTVTGETGILRDWELRLYGELSDDNDVYVYTNEYASLGEAGRAILTDSSGIDIINTSAVTGGVVIDLSGEYVSYIAGRDLFIDSGTIIEDIYTGDGDDVLIGNDAFNYLYGGRGDDVITGRMGDDHLDGGDGNDNLFGNEGDDQLNGGSGFDVLVGAEGNDMLFGGGELDLIIGGAGEDTIFGEDGDDFLFGSDGSDAVYGAGGNDTIYGDGSLDYNTLNVVDYDAQHGNDELYGGAGDDVILAFNGNDYVSGGSGSDIIFGHEGDDDLHGDSGDDEIQGGQGDDVIYAGTGNDAVKGEGGNDIIYGCGGNDWLSGGAGSDVITSGSGDVVQLIGGDGGDTFKIDLRELSDHNVYDVIHDFDTSNPNEKIDLSAFDLTAGQTLFKAQLGDHTYIVLNGFSGFYQYLVLKNTNVTDVNAGHFVNADIALYNYLEVPEGQGDNPFVGTDDHDYILGTDAPEIIEGGAGDDIILGGGGDDVLLGETGEDWIFGEGGDDVIYGGSGNDVLIGGAGDDTIDGQDGDDWVQGDAGDDTLYGSSDDDVILGGSGNDELHGGSGNDVLEGDYVIDLSIEENSYDDKLYGDEGNDFLLGMEGSDELYGGAGDDILGNGTRIGGIDDGINNYFYGGSGNDLIHGGNGDDLISGGAGHNVIYLRHPYYSGISSDTDTVVITENAGGRDTVVNFRPDSDKLDLSAFDSDLQEVVMYEFGVSSTEEAGVMLSLGSDQYIIIKDVSSNDLISNWGSSSANGEGILIADHGIDIVRASESISSIQGTESDDTINVGDQDAIVYGSGGNDVVIGGSGSDFISGGYGNKIIKGRGGDDILVSGVGDNIISGGQGEDVYVIGNNKWHKNIITDYTPGEDRVDVSMLFDIAQAKFSKQKIFVDEQDDNVIFYFKDSILVIQNTAYSEIDFNDFIGLEEYYTTRKEYDSTNEAELGLGNNLVDGSDTDLFVITAKYWGTDVITGFDPAVDKIDLSDIVLDWHYNVDDIQHLDIKNVSGDAVISFGSGGYQKIVLRGIDAGALNLSNFLGISYNSRIGEDFSIGFDKVNIVGGSGDDLLLGDMYTESIDGGDGDDVIYANTHFGLRITGGGLINGTVVGENVVTSDVDEITVTGGSGGDTYIIGANSRKVVITDFEYGQDKVDLSAWEKAKYFTDLNISQQGADAVVGIADDNVVITFRNSDKSSLTPEHFISVIDTENIHDDQVLQGSRVYGGFGNDTLKGTLGDDVLKGGDGDDILQAYSGKNYLTGGDGSDLFVVHEGYSSSHNIVTDFDISKDKIDLTSFADSASYGNRLSALKIIKIEDDTIVEIKSESIFITLQNTDPYLLTKAHFIGLIDDIDAFTVYEKLALGDKGSTEDQLLEDDGYDGKVYGGHGNDILKSSAGDDYLDGGLGDDRLIVDGGGIKTLVGGGGSDVFVIDETEDNTTVTITDFDATKDALDLTAFAEKDYHPVKYFSQLDLIQNGDDTIINIDDGTTKIVLRNVNKEELSNSNIIGVIDPYTITEDQLLGMDQDNVKYVGGAGSDVLTGGDGDDVLEGGGGRDILYGGLGVNLLTGGDDCDTFVIEDRSTARTDYAITQVITDFTPGEDQVNLSQLQNFELNNETIMDSDVGVIIRPDENHEIIIKNVAISQLSISHSYDVPDIILPWSAYNPVNVDSYESNITIEGSFWFGDCIWSFGDDNVINTINGDDFVVSFGAGCIINGGDGDDNLNAAEGDQNQLSGDDGNDELGVCEGSNNVLDGGAGNDVLTIDGDAQNTILIGGDGNDEFVMGSTNEHCFAVIDDFSQEDVINLWDFDVHDVNELAITQDGDDAILCLDGSYTLTLRNIDVGALTNDQFIFSPDYGATDGDDVITGTDYDDEINAKGGDDIIYLSRGFDHLVGGAGSDVFVVPRDTYNYNDYKMVLIGDFEIDYDKLDFSYNDTINSVDDFNMYAYEFEMPAIDESGEIDWNNVEYMTGLHLFDTSIDLYGVSKDQLSEDNFIFS